MSSFSRFIFVTDSHGDMCDWSVWKECLSFIKFWRPHLIVHGGDALDLRPYRKGAGKDEQMERITEDMVAFRRLFEELQPHVWLEGNHDKRLRDGADSGSNVDRSELCRRYLAETDDLMLKLKVRHRLPYHHSRGVFKEGNLRFLHGYRTGVNCAKAHAESYGSCIFGHTHTYQRYTSAHLDDTVAISSPIIGKVDMPYLDAFTGALRHRQGWTYGVIHNKTGKWEAWSTVFDPELGGYIDPIKMIAPLLSKTL